MPIKSDAVDRAKDAIALMDKGVPITDACKRSGTTYGTVRKVLRLLGRRVRLKRTATGRKRVLTDAKRVEKAEAVLRHMQYDGMSATDACRECHTSIGTVRDVRFDGCRLLRRHHRRHKLQVYEVSKLAVVFYGRLRNAGSPIAITSVRGVFDDPKTIDRGTLPADNYASIMWQFDFEEFRTTLSPEDLCDYYMELVFAFLRGEVQDTRVSKTIVSWLARFGTTGLASLVASGIITQTEADEIMAGTRPYDISVLEELFRLGVELDATDYRCGVDDRHKKSEFVCKSKLKAGDPVIDDGYFQVVVLRRSGVVNYPPRPRKIPYKHSLLEERTWMETP